MLFETIRRRYRAAQLYRYFRAHMSSAIPIPIIESNENWKHGLTPGSTGTLWVRRTRFGQYEPTEIVVKHQLTPDVKMFITLHELGHWYCHHCFGKEMIRDRPQQEIEADAFAWMGMRSYGLEEVVLMDEETIWTGWQATKGRYPDTIERVTRSFDQFWMDFGKQAKDATE